MHGLKTRERIILVMFIVRLYLRIISCSTAGPVMEDWDIISPKDVIGSEQLLADKTRSLASAALPFTQSLLSQVSLPSLPSSQSLLPPPLYTSGSLLMHLFLCSGGPDSVQSSAGLQLVLWGGDQAFQAPPERR